MFNFQKIVLVGSKYTLLALTRLINCNAAQLAPNEKYLRSEGFSTRPPVADD